MNNNPVAKKVYEQSNFAKSPAEELSDDDMEDESSSI